MDKPRDVVVARDDEEAVAVEMEASEEAVEEVGDLGVLLREAPIRGVTREADEIDRAVLEENPEVVLPGGAENTPAAPWLVLPRSPLVEIGQVEDAQPVAWLGQGTSLNRNCFSCSLVRGAVSSPEDRSSRTAAHASADRICVI
jgi:hypothetical protein